MFERLEKKIQKTDTCWNWISSGNENKYGHFYHKGKSYMAHRFVYEQLVGPIPPARYIDHVCQNKRCVNPAHLEPVSPSENNKRGNSMSGLNARKTHCNWGHPLSGKNMRLLKEPGTMSTYHRVCLACKARLQKEYTTRKYADGKSWRKPRADTDYL